VLEDLGDPTGARSLHERALAAREARLGTQHPSLSMSLINLSTTLMSQGDAVQAKATLTRALSLLGIRFYSEPSGASTATREDFPRLHVDSRDLPRAQAALDQALALDEEDFLPEHRGVASSLNRLGNLLTSFGDLVGARSAFEAALAVRSTHLSPDHPEAADSLDRLGRVLADSGDLNAAWTLHERALAIRFARLSPDHELTLRSRANLAAVQALLGNRP
jgi:tetratricopeptide (TPR) repeat protein